MCDALDLVFPNTTLPVSSPGDVAVRAIPTAVALLLWVGFELTTRRHALPLRARRQASVVGVGAAAVLGFLAWRVFDVFRCYARPYDDVLADYVTPVNGTVDEELESLKVVASLENWRYVGVAGAPLVGVGLVVLFAPRAPRLGILLALALAGGTVAVEWLTRHVPHVPFAAVQHMWLFYVVSLWSFLPVRAPRSKAALPHVDPLRKDPPPAEPERTFTWFW